MRFMILVRPATTTTATARRPSNAPSTSIARYHEQLSKAGVLLDAAAAADYTLIQVRTREEALEWARRLPPSCGEAEVHQLCEADAVAQRPVADQLRAASHP